MPPEPQPAAVRGRARAAKPPAPDVHAIFERGVADIRLAHELALGGAVDTDAAAPRHLSVVAPGPRQQTLSFDPEPASITSPAPLAPEPEVRRNWGSRKAPYKRQDGVEMIKQSFCATEAFDSLWRKLDGALPRTVTKNEWLEEVLTRAIVEQLKRG